MYVCACVSVYACMDMTRYDHQVGRTRNGVGELRTVRYGLVLPDLIPSAAVETWKGKGVGDDAEEVRALTPLPSPPYVYLSTLG